MPVSHLSGSNLDMSFVNQKAIIAQVLFLASRYVPLKGDEY